MTRDLADELERLATKLDDEPDAARRIYRTAALSLWVERNRPQILSALRAKPAEGEPVACPDRPAVDLPALQREVAGIIVRDVLQEEYDDLVEGYLDEIMRASLRIIRLPGYSVVARAFETNLSASLISAGDELDKAKAENARMREALGMIAEGSAPPIPHGHYLAHRRAVDVARVALSGKAG